MQASKIKVDTVYALNIVHDGKNHLVRYQVSAVVTRRNGRTGSPHDYVSSIEGWVNTADLPAGYTLKPSPGAPRSSNSAIWSVVAPDAVQGPFEEVVELRAKDEAEKAARKAAEAEKYRRTQAVRLVLYKLAGLTAPQDGSAYNQPFRAGSYSSGVDITATGIEALYAALVEEKADV